MISRISRKFGDKINPLLAKKRRSKLLREDFTIISNNCWAGNVYRYFGLPYNGPTEGLYFFAKDFVNFVSRLRHYTSCPLTFIDACDSKHFEELKIRGETNIPLGMIDDVEIVFLHYSTEDEARAKWEKRCARINWNNLFLKFSQMNECGQEELKAFDSLSSKNKICFVCKKEVGNIKCGVCYPSRKEENQIKNDTDYFARYFDIIEWLNSPADCYCENKNG